jgi:hypothetical protein
LVIGYLCWRCNRQNAPIPIEDLPPGIPLDSRAAIEREERERRAVPRLPPIIEREIVLNWELDNEGIASNEELSAIPSRKNLR